ncbi:LOG family protein [Leptolinea tardivitalis]|uniref:LOG family protein n=1 Tax=Leptolinea tardivitalis TaxID=229920 RepID=UPI0007836805|nr:LOG family protein [Leptolinea tardivitalis]GAP19870.1 predicted Rossmann fold nucleotide-binding protein [Leptolinea tardivitalis]
MKVAVFGGAGARPEDEDYQQAVRLGAYLANAGHIVMTGGYIGMMEAASKGAAEAGGHVIGVTCDEIEAFRPTKPNRWVKEEWRFVTLTDRMMNLVSRCDAAIALPGGVGTLTEISVLWNQVLVHAIPVKPVILIGQGWKQIFDSIFRAQDEYITAHDRTLISFAADIESAVRLLSDANLS